MAAGALAEAAGAALPAAAEVAAATVPEFAPVIVESLVEPQALDAVAQLTADFETAGIDPVRSIEDLAKETSPLNLPKVENATPLPEQKPTTSEERMNAYIENGMQKWEADNLMPNRDANPDEFEQWQTDKVTHREQMKVNAQFHEDIRTWEETHPDPGKDKDPKGHAQWEEAREAHKKELKAAQEKSEPDAEKKDEQTDEEAQKEAEKALENPENQSKLAKLKELYQKRAVLLGEKVSLEQIVAAAQKAKTDYAGVLMQLTENSGKLSNIEREIQQLESELKITKPKVGLIIKAVLALFGAGALLAVSGAKQA